MERIILGISLGFNSSACIMSDERGLIAAISEERLNNKKNTKDIPLKAIAKCLEIAKCNEIDRIAISHYEHITNEYFNEHWPIDEYRDSHWDLKLVYYIQSLGVKVNNILCDRVEHHLAHQLSALAIYGVPKDFEEHYLISSDGFGDGSSGEIFYHGIYLDVVELRNSIALVYQFVTGALGFKEHQHEGKITGLAAYGQPKYLENIENLFDIINEHNGLNFKYTNENELDSEECRAYLESNIIDFDDFLRLKKTVYKLVNDLISEGATREDIAASVQEFAEKYTLLWLERYCENHNANAYLSGGLFANVKINQRIKDSGLFKNVFVTPPMGDEGTCLGAALCVLGLENYPKVKTMYNNTTSGSNVSMVLDSVLDVIINTDYKVETYAKEDLVNVVAKNLSEDKIVCLVRDNMEFGPRALCHRSILYNATKKETNDSLNKRLSRSEFMPFAPVCRREVAEDLFKNLEGGEITAKFMTMTFDGTDEFINTYKAVAHIDGTARPQIIDYSDDNFMWKVLEQYENLTNLKCIVNTSFNLHEYPIVENVEMAIKSFIKADLDVLVIENVVISK